jgi:hypothetical protein
MNEAHPSRLDGEAVRLGSGCEDLNFRYLQPTAGYDHHVQETPGRRGGFTQKAEEEFALREGQIAQAEEATA